MRIFGSAASLGSCRWPWRLRYKDGTRWDASVCGAGDLTCRSRGCFWVWRSRPPRYARTRPPHTILSMGRVLRQARLAFLLAAVALAAIAPVHMAGAATGTARLSAARSAISTGAVAGKLNGVAAASAKDAWAVGYTADSAATDRTLILHWNGRRWSPATSF